MFMTNVHNMMVVFFFFLAALFMRVNCTPVAKRLDVLSPCFMNCTSIAITTGCTSIFDLACVCNNQAFLAVQTACIHQQCPDMDAELAQYQVDQCAPYVNGTIASVSGVTGTSIPTNFATQTPRSSSSLSSEIAAQLEGISNPSYSARTAIIIGSVIGFVVLVMVGFFIAWCWKERQYRSSDYSKENKDSVSGLDEYPPYDNHGNTVTPWIYPNPSSSSAERLNPSNDDLPRPHPLLALTSLTHSPPRTTRDDRNKIRPFILPPLVRAREDSPNRADFYSQPAVAVKSKKRGRISLGLPPSYHMSLSDLETRPSSSEL